MEFIGYIHVTMAPLLFPTYGLTAEQVQLITQVYETVKHSRPDAEFDFDFQPALGNYEAIQGHYGSWHCGPVLRMEKDPTSKYLCFINVNWNALGSGLCSIPSPYADFQTWGVAGLGRKYGHVLIRPETTLDKIRELIHHAEINFEEDREFSKAFYVLANEEETARKLLGPAMRKAIAGLKLKDFVVEVIDDVMIVGDNKCIDLTTAGEMASFLCGLSPMT